MGILLGCGIAASTLVAVNALPADEAVASGLVSFGSCPDVLDHLKREADERIGPWGLQDTWHGDDVLVLEQETTDGEAAAMDGDDSAGADGSRSSTSYSTTNVQEGGVDEPDIVKTDGNLVVTTLGSNLRTVDITGDHPEEVGSLKLTDDYADAELLLEGDRAVVFVQGWTPVDAGPAPSETAWERPMTTVLLVDLSDPADPTVESSLEIDGNHLDARMVDGTIRMVTSSEPGLVFPMGEKDWERDEDELIERNRDIVADSTIEDWLPSYRLDAGGEESSGQLVGCDALNRPRDFAGFSVISVLTLGFDELIDADGVGVLSSGETVYASADQLYVATANVETAGEFAPMEAIDAPITGPGWPQVESTGIHAFDIGGDEPARYLASGEVAGGIIGSYAMSEHDGVLRVATTTRSGDGRKSESQVITLTEQGDDLIQVGQVGGLGKGEDIYAVRYFEDTAYVVTFRQIDPLYVLDLSDPANPSVEGELKITGYSSYLHGVGDGRLVGVGQEATDDGQAVGTQVSLFDVSDPADPRKLDGHVVDGTWSDVESDPHAFLYWPETRQAVVPISGAEMATADGFTMEPGGALVVTLEGDAVTAQGMVNHGGGQGARDEEQLWEPVLRSMVIDDSLYTLWHDGLQVNDLDDLGLQSWTELEPAW
ncbi:beta-propeller domain-containing protein [Phytoactinopolyspora endophytica]|uniref:beta-propeller domain-containing protein n=1 Tax=Phytoactinopolyspora endophytica TaxID=1642495 RepID=UPI0013ED625F|nr:beta-propeller domain-containing protein [Phytoactinopolyspora endophytica]